MCVCTHARVRMRVCTCEYVRVHAHVQSSSSRKSQFKSAERGLEVRPKAIIVIYVRVEPLRGVSGYLHCPKLGCRLGKFRRISEGPGPEVRGPEDSMGRGGGTPGPLPIG